MLSQAIGLDVRENLDRPAARPRAGIVPPAVGAALATSISACAAGWPICRRQSATARRSPGQTQASPQAADRNSAESHKHLACRLPDAIVGVSEQAGHGGQPAGVAQGSKAADGPRPAIPVGLR